MYLEVDYDDLVKDLRNNIMEVTFSSQETGLQRVMKCTLLTEKLPPKTKNVIPQVKKAGIVAVWDLEKEGWRSFKLDKILEIKKLNE